VKNSAGEEKEDLLAAPNEVALPSDQQVSDARPLAEAEAALAAANEQREALRGRLAALLSALDEGTASLQASATTFTAVFTAPSPLPQRKIRGTISTTTTSHHTTITSHYHHHQPCHYHPPTTNHNLYHHQQPPPY